MSDPAHATPAPLPHDAGAMAGSGHDTGAMKARWAALGAGVAALLLLFFIWPYQHWFYAGRSSVMHGWFRTVGESFGGEWMFCYFVPLLTGFLIHLRRAELRSLPLCGEWAGALLAVPALFVYWVGYKADTGYAGFLSAHLMMAALILLLGGRRWMRVLIFPWLFLFFMWPMFPIEERVVGKLRVITATLSGELLHLIGVPVVREGTALNSAADAVRGMRLGQLFQLDVEEPCSGVRSLYSLLMVSALYGYLSLKRVFPRLVLFASAIPLAMLGNVVRMVLLALGSIWFGSEFAIGRNLGADHQEMSAYHTLCGYAVFAVALAGMFGLCSLLEGSHWKSFKNLKKKAARPAASAADAVDAASTRRTIVMSGVAVGIAVAGLGICAVTNVNPAVAAPGVVMDLPLQFDKYQGIPNEMTAIERNVLDPGVSLVRNQYISPDRHMLVATVIESGVGKRTLHRPEVCLPGQGWSITDQMTVPIRLADGRAFEGTLLRMFREVEVSPGVRKRVRALNIYWYIGSDGTTTPEFYDHLRISYMDAVFKNLAHRWAMASFFLPLPESEIGFDNPMIEATALEELRDFSAGLAASFMKKPPSP
ncbi:MAG: exosortase-associated EpsI family protein [Verrucomicrobiaceae bacterium]|nr:exosortase-associated EpsI family protein [Verrucomicrobiaceae bacterium]